MLWIYNSRDKCCSGCKSSS